MYVLLPICIAVGCVGFPVTRHGVEMGDLCQEGTCCAECRNLFLHSFGGQCYILILWLVTICWRDRHCFENREAFLWRQCRPLLLLWTQYSFWSKHHRLRRKCYRRLKKLRRYISHCIREELNSSEKPFLFIRLDLKSHQTNNWSIVFSQTVLIEVLKI